MEVYENIKFIRQFKKLSQEQMAEKLDMSLNGYAKIEHGKVDINLSRLRKISDILGVKLEQMVGLNDKNVFNFIENNNAFLSNHNQHNTFDQTTYKHELEKANLIIEQKDKEIAYLKEIIELVKK